jgi:hypothetical protein
MLNRQTVKNVLIPLVPGEMKLTVVDASTLQVARRGESESTRTSYMVCADGFWGRATPWCLVQRRSRGYRKIQGDYPSVSNPLAKSRCWC